MSLRFLRSVFCLAALAAGLALLLPTGQAGWVAALLAGFAMAAMAFFRSAQTRRAHVDAVVGNASFAAPRPTLDWRDAAASIADACRDAASFDAALHAVGAVVKGEIGARGLRSYRVESRAGEPIRLVELIATQAEFRGLPRRLSTDDSLLAAAIERRLPALAMPHAAALPVSVANAVVALIEFGSIDLEVDPQALLELLARAGSALSEIATPDRVAPPPISAPIAPRAPAALSNRRILLVEPEVGACSSLRPVLNRLGAEVVQVATGEAARRAQAETQFDLLLADVDAGWCGADLPCGVPRVAVSGQARATDETIFHERGFDALLCRPCSESQLLAMLTRHFRVPACQPAGDAASGASPQTTATLLDAGALARLAELDPTGENHLLQRVLRAYETSVARLMPMFHEARKRDDLAGMRHVAHTLKSSSASIGAIKFAGLCAEIESMIRSQSIETLDERADQLCVELGFVLKAVGQLLDGGP